MLCALQSQGQEFQVQRAQKITAITILPIFTTNFTEKYNKMLGCPLSVLFTALNDINNTVTELALFQVVF